MDVDHNEAKFIILCTNPSAAFQFREVKENYQCCSGTKQEKVVPLFSWTI